jgi:hypothetical protein
MYLHTLFLTRGRLESTWTVLKLFGEFTNENKPAHGPMEAAGLDPACLILISAPHIMCCMVQSTA